jgi:hypothetical protein
MKLVPVTILGELGDSAPELLKVHSQTVAAQS